MKVLHRKTGHTGRVIKLAFSLIFYFGNWLWCRLRELAGTELPGTCVVLYYHAVPSRYRDRFANQMNVLMRCARPVKSDYRQPLESGVHHVAVVFHDAFASVCENALPELARHHIPSTLFAPSGYLGRRQGWITDKEHPDYGEIVVDAERLKSFDRDLVSIGSHTITHADLSILTEKDALDELERSKIDLEAVLGRPVQLFAFPYGRCNESLANLAKQAGYQRVFTIKPQLAFSEPDEFVTGSCSVSPTDWDLEFRLKLLGAYHWMPPIYRFRHRTGLLLKSWASRTKQNGLAVNGRSTPETTSAGETEFEGSAGPQERG